jgi:hypothetical protein
LRQQPVLSANRVPSANQRLEIIFQRARLTPKDVPNGYSNYELWVNGRAESLSAFTEADDIAAPFIKTRPMQNKVNTDSAFKQAQAWIRDCAYHEHCPEPAFVQLPTRVIEVSPDGCPDTPRLWSSTGHGHSETGSYTALSYCWGENQPGATTLKSLPARLKRIKIEELSQTIRDAIYCTKRLGIKYLWVDALCIVQDSVEDKTRELARMRDIYQNSHITIVAASSQRATEGFLQDRPAPSCGLRVPFPCPNNQTGTMSLNYGPYQSSAHQENQKEPINLRAWTLQEALISTRLLIYRSHTLHFQCRSATAQLGGSTVYVNLTLNRLEPYFFSPQRRKLKLSPEKTKETLRHWGGIVNNYTQRGLTDSKDKLIALAGIAELFSKQLRTRYLAGLWETDILRQLMWFVLNAGVPRPKEYRAPTWSWACMDTGIFCTATGDGTDSVPFKCRVLDCSTTLLPNDILFGSVNSGRLKIKGALRKAWITSRTRLLTTTSMIWEKVSTPLSSDDDRPQRKRRRLYVEPNGLFGQLDSEDDVCVLPQMVYCLAILLTFNETDPHREHSKDINIKGLLLTPSLREQACFRRIGTFSKGKKSNFRSSVCDRQVIEII